MTLITINTQETFIRDFPKHSESTSCGYSNISHNIKYAIYKIIDS